MPTRRSIVASGCAACAAMASPGPASLAAPTGEIREAGYALRFIGSVRDTIMMGKRNALLDLRTLRGVPHLWGLGPLEGLTGEVTIANSRPAQARVGADRAVHVMESFDGGVPFFVWAEVPNWQTIKLPSNIRTFDALEAFVGDVAKKSGFTRAFPFTVQGRPRLIDFHVVDGRPDTPAGMEAHRKIRIPFELSRPNALFVGFWSSSHQGIFTPMGSNMHVHFQTPDNLVSGHVQGLDLVSNEMTLSLPQS